MSIHEISNNIKKVSEIVETELNIKENITAENDKEINNAVNEVGIHVESSHDTLLEKNINTENKKQYFIKNNQKQLINRNIMRDIFNDSKKININSSNVKSIIRSGKIKNKQTNNSYLRKSIPTSHSYGNFLRKDPEITTFPVEFETFNNSSSYVGDTKNMSFDMFEHNNNCNCPVFYLNKETPKLSEIISDILKSVDSGEIKTIDNVIAKLRVSYEEKNIFTNKKKKNIILLIFEDDTIKPVIEIEDKSLCIIQKWYEDCNLILDIEKTDAFIPESITVQDISSVLFNEINYKYKNDFLYEYLPLIINNIITNNYIKEHEKIYHFLNINNKTKTNAKINANINANTSDIYYSFNEFSKDFVNNVDISDNLYKEYGIKIPENLLTTAKKKDNISDYYINVNNKNAKTDNVCGKNIMVKSSDYDRTKVIDDDMFEPYNAIYIFSKNIDTDKEQKEIFSYNKEYNLLKPNFSENSESVEIIPKNDYQITESIFVIYNYKFFQTLCLINPDSSVINILKNNSEFGFIKLFNITTNNKEIIKFIKNEFDKIQFNDIDELNYKINVTSQYIDFSNKYTDTDNVIVSEETQVKKYIASSFTINNDINNKMKASILHDMIINSKIVNIEQSKISGFKNRLSKYLKDLGLEKKRYNDGYYYYGIKNNNDKYKYEEFKSKTLNEHLSEHIKQRLNEESIFLLQKKDN
jgi:hypothetical protein